MITARGGKSGPACLSLKREGRMALVSVIGRELSRAHSEKALKTADTAGIRTSAKTFSSKNSFTLQVPAPDGERLLRAIHAEFFG
jgi:aspartokinase